MLKLYLLESEFLHISGITQQSSWQMGKTVLVTKISEISITFILTTQIEFIQPSLFLVTPECYPRHTPQPS